MRGIQNTHIHKINTSFKGPPSIKQMDIHFPLENLFTGNIFFYVYNKKVVLAMYTRNFEKIFIER